MWELTESAYNSLSKSMSEHVPFTYHFDEKDWQAIADYYFRPKNAKALSEAESKEKLKAAQEAMHRFGNNYPYQAYDSKSSIERETVGKYLANFLYIFHLQATSKAGLSEAEGMRQLDAMTHELLNYLALRDAGNEACFQRLNMHRKLEMIFDFKVPVKLIDASENETIVNQSYQEQLYDDIVANDKIQQHEIRARKFLRARNNFNQIFEIFFSDNYTDGQRLRYLEGKLISTENQEKFLNADGIEHLRKFLHILENDNHPEAFKHIEIIRGRFYQAMRAIIRHPDEHYRTAAKHFYDALGVNNKKNKPTEKQELFKKISELSETQARNPREMYFHVHPEKKRISDPKANILLIVFSTLAYGVRKAISWVTPYTFSTQNEVWAWIKQQSHYLYKEVFTYAGMKSLSPGTKWSLAAAGAGLAVFAGLATYGILPLTVILFTLPTWVPIMGGNVMVGSFLFTALPAVMYIVSKVVNYFHGDDYNHDLINDIENEEFNAEINAQRKNIIFMDEYKPLTQEVSSENKLEGDVECEKADSSFTPMS